MTDGLFGHDVIKGMLHNSLSFSLKLLVLSDPLFVGFDQIRMFCTLDQPARFVFGTPVKKTAVQACFCLVMLYPVDGFAMIFEIPTRIRSQGFSCWTKVLVQCFVKVKVSHIKSHISSMLRLHSFSNALEDRIRLR